MLMQIYAIKISGIQAQAKHCYPNVVDPGYHPQGDIRGGTAIDCNLPIPYTTLSWIPIG